MPVHELVRIFLVLIAAVVTTMLGMRFLTPQTIQEPLNKQFAIFRNKHNWVMTWLYVMTFGSFIGYANAFPKLIDDVFVNDTEQMINGLASSKPSSSRRTTSGSARRSVRSSVRSAVGSPTNSAALA